MKKSFRGWFGPDKNKIEQPAYVDLAASNLKGILGYDATLDRLCYIDADGTKRYLLFDNVTDANGTAANGVTLDGVTLKDGGISTVSQVTEYTKLVTITSAQIVGTAAGDLGHANGATLVAAPSSDYALEFVSATLIYDFATAAYTGAGANDLVIRIGTTSVSSAIADADLLLAAGDQVVHVRALSAADYDLPVGSSINLKSTEVTQPGTAAGVIRVLITYRVITTGL